MKFGKRLQSQLEETLPEWRDKYLSYKQLKKRLKVISAPECFTEAAFSSPCREEPESLAKSVVDAAVEELKRGQPDQPATSVNSTAGIAREAESQDSNVNGAGTATEDTGPKSTTGSAGITSECLEYDSGMTDMRNLTEEEVDFVHLLNAELEKFNSFFIEKEEEYVIRLQELKERIENVKDKSCKHGASPSGHSLNEELIIIRKDIVKFHGEMVLLENYSSLNYTGLVKILKKHDKRTGALLRIPFIRNVLHQPFFTTELLSKLVRDCELNLQSLFPSSSAACDAQENGFKEGALVDSLADVQQGIPEGREALEEKLDLPANKEVADVDAQGQSLFPGEDVENIYRSTVVALRTIKDLRRGSSTYSVFSLPPFDRSEDDSEDDDKKSRAPCCSVIPERK